MSSWASGLLSRVPAVMSVIVMEPLMMTSLTENVCSSTTSVPFDVNNRVSGQWAVCVVMVVGVMVGVVMGVGEGVGV